MNEAHRKAKELFSAIAEHTVMGPPEYFSSERFETMWQSELKLISSDDSAERQPSSSCKRRKTNGKKRNEYISKQIAYFVRIDDACIALDISNNVHTY